MVRNDLPDLLYKTIQSLGGKASMMDIFREFWKLYASKLDPAEDMFYTWNYDIRWAATELRKNGRMKPAHSKENPEELVDESPKGIWEII